MKKDMIEMMNGKLQDPAVAIDYIVRTRAQKKASTKYSGKKDATRILKRHPQNPLLHVKDYPGVAQIYNPSPVMYNGQTILLVSVVDHKTPGLGRDVGQTRIARSIDGINFELSAENFVKVPAKTYPYSSLYHFIDNRVTKIGDTYYMITPVGVRGFMGPVGVLGKTKDFETYDCIDIITQPPSRGASLFPEKINGKYYKIDRPSLGGAEPGHGEMWLSSSPDLVHWGSFRPLLAPNYKFWNVNKIGPTPPIKTDEGWLVIVHGVFTPAGGTYYYIGAILLDLDDPAKIIGKTSSYLLGPEEDYERHGNCDNTVFPCGAIANYETDKLRLYYGACDSCICLATGSLSEVVNACIEEI